jgi:hypothetical protein
MKMEIQHALVVGKENLARLLREDRKLDDDLKRIAKQRQQLGLQITEWEKVVNSLSVVSDDAAEELPADVTIPGSDDEGLAPTFVLTFTNGIRYILERRDRPVTPPEIRDELIALGFDLSKYKQELVPIHNALKRLEEQGEVERVTLLKGSRVAYIWINPMERAKREMQEVQKRRVTPLSELMTASHQGMQPADKEK